MLFLTNLLPSEPIALISKVKGKVKIKKNKSNVFKSLDRELTILNLDEINLKRNSFIKIIFLDDGNKLMSYQESESMIKADFVKRNLKKTIQIKEGIFKIHIEKKINNEMSFDTPYSIIKCSNLSNPVNLFENGFSTNI